MSTTWCTTGPVPSGGPDLAGGFEGPGTGGVSFRNYRQARRWSSSRRLAGGPSATAHHTRPGERTDWVTRRDLAGRRLHHRRDGTAASTSCTTPPGRPPRSTFGRSSGPAWVRSAPTGALPRHDVHHRARLGRLGIRPCRRGRSELRRQGLDVPLPGDQQLDWGNAEWLQVPGLGAERLPYRLVVDNDRGAWADPYSTHTLTEWTSPPRSPAVTRRCPCRSSSSTTGWTPTGPAGPIGTPGCRWPRPTCPVQRPRSGSPRSTSRHDGATARAALGAQGEGWGRRCAHRGPPASSAPGHGPGQ